MRKIPFIGATTALAGLMVAQAAHAENAIYEGVCTRAYEVKANNSVDKIMQFSTYKGVSLHRFAAEAAASCKTDLAMVRTLTLASRTSLQATYNLVRKDILIGSQNNGCADLKLKVDTITGTATFTTELIETSNGCEVFVRVDWNVKDTASTWTTRFVTRVMMLNDGSMVMAQPGPSSELYSTPIAFSGVK